MTRRLAICAAALMALVTMTACGGTNPSADPSNGPSGPTATSTGGGDPDNTAGPSPTPTKGSNGGISDGGDDGFAYLPWGPGDPPIPGQYATMAASGGSAPNCDGLANELPEGTFWQIALGVCRAVVEGADWPPTNSVPEPPQAPNDYEECLNAELKAMLERALRWHAENPGRQPKVDYPSGASTSPCQARIYQAVALKQAADSSGKVPVAITATALDKNPSVSVDGQSVGIADFDSHDSNDHLATVVVLVEIAEQPRTAQIKITTDRGPMQGTVELPGSGASPPPTDVTTETDPPTTDPPATDPPAADPPAGESQATQAPEE